MKRSFERGSFFLAHFQKGGGDAAEAQTIPNKKGDRLADAIARRVCRFAAEVRRDLNLDARLFSYFADRRLMLAFSFFHMAFRKRPVTCPMLDHKDVKRAFHFLKNDRPAGTFMSSRLLEDY
jgi:hypothetical protein